MEQYVGYSVYDIHDGSSKCWTLHRKYREKKIPVLVCFSDVYVMINASFGSIADILPLSFVQDGPNVLSTLSYIP